MANKIIQIGEHKIKLPAYPSSRDEILFINERDPYWRRQEDIPRIFYDYNKYLTALNQDNTLYDQDGNLVSLSIDDTRLVKRFQDRELKRRVHGIWFKNGNDVMWMPGDYYFNLQWAPMLSLAKKYGDFRWFQNDAMIIKNYIDHDENILGGYFSKAKKTGISQIIAGAYANESTMTRGRNFGIMSKDFQNDTKALNMAMYFYIIDGLPDILLPEVRKRNEHELLFGKSVNHRSLKTSTKPLGTRVFASKTKPSGFDGPLMYKVWLDEFPKYWESAKQSPDMVFKKTQETVKQQQLIKGKLYLTSYSTEDNNRGYYEAQKIYFDGKLSTKDKIMGRTKNGLISHFIGTLESAEGCFLKNGKTDQKKAFYFNEAERDLVKGDRLALQAKMRQYPRTEEEAWGEGGNTSVFDTIRLGIQIKENDDELRSGVRPYREGRLVWDNSLWEMGKQNTRPAGVFAPVHFEELTREEIISGKEGRLHIFGDLPFETCRSLIKNKRDEYGRLMPVDDSENIGAIDPTDYAIKSDVVVGSKNASHTGNLYNPILDTRYGKPISDILLAEYFHRPENPDEFYEDMVKEIIFFDKWVLPESNKKWLVTAFKKDNLHNFLLMRKKDGTIGPYAYGDDDRLMTTTHEVIDAYVRAIKKYIAEVKGGTGIDRLALIKTQRLLKQLANFKADDTKKFDLAVCFGLLRLAVESFSIFKSGLNQNDNDDAAMKIVVHEFLNL